MLVGLKGAAEPRWQHVTGIARELPATPDEMAGLATRYCHNAGSVSASGGRHIYLAQRLFVRNDAKNDKRTPQRRSTNVVR